MTISSMQRQRVWAILVACLMVPWLTRHAAAQDTFGYWIFAGEGTTVADVSGHDHHGTLFNFSDTSSGAGDAQGGSGWLSGGYGLQFDGRSYEGQNGAQGENVNDYVETTLPTADLSGHSWTFEFIGTHNNPSQNWSPFIGQQNGCCIFFGKRGDDNRLHANIAGITTSEFNSDYLPNLADGNPHHYALVFDDAADTLTMYFDGQNVGSSSGLGGALATDRGNLWLGGVAHNAFERWDGTIFQTRVTRDSVAGDGTGALSPAEFVNGGLPDAGLPTRPAESNLGNALAYDNFASVDAGQLRVFGNAIHSPAESRIRLTPSSNDSVGAVVTNGPLQFAPDYSFDTTFTLEMGDGVGVDCCGDLPGADGVTFVLHQNPNGSLALGARGGGMGVYNAPHAIDSPSLVIEFDTWNGGSFDHAVAAATNGNHIAINVHDADGPAPGVSIAQTAPGAIPQLTNGVPKTARVIYDGQSEQLLVFMDEGTAEPTSLVLSTHVELKQLFSGSEIYGGFTAATGGARHHADLLSWQFQSPETSPAPPSGRTTGEPEFRTFSDFSDISGFTLNGHAVQDGDQIRLTAAEASQAGSAVMSEPVEFFDTMQFVASFDMEMTDPAGGGPPSQTPGADGIVFFVAQSPIVGAEILGGVGGDNGFNTASGPPAQNYVAVGFDTWSGGFGDQPGDPMNHLDIITSDGGRLAVTGELPIFNDGGIHHAIVDYDGSNLNVRFWRDGEPVPELPTLTAALSMEELFGYYGDQELYFGFTAATGGSINNHYLRNFNLSIVPEPSCVVLVGAGLAALFMARRRRPNR